MPPLCRTTNWSIFPSVLMVRAAVIGGCIVTSSLVKDAQKYKTSVYYSLACFYVFVGCTDAQARHLFRTETVRGQQIGRLQQQQQPSKKAQTTRQTTSWRRLLRVFLHDLPLFVSALFAAAIALKILLQESAKHLLAKRRRANMRMMAIIVAAPTILVDTQLRTVLLCLNNASKTIVGSMLFAAGEVSMRVGKTRYMERMARRMAARRSLPPSLPGRVQTARIHVQPRRAPSLDTIDPIQDRVSRLLSLHAAEIYSEMYAKYIAMGCSYAILFFFGSHPKYDLGLVGSTPESSTSTGTAFRVQWRNVGTAGFQLGIEILVDIVACAFEIRSGIEFEHFNKDDSFLAVFMVAIALVNVHISSSVYLHS
ncbi:hypothetical protein PHYBOEH_003819 [Phytophthora boehmeriae]|uniref:Transmembrane protein n=1 Tax=Phytophthora boehmeriae TaxID=109152 RepID=A0A8T1X9C4_9STRA|nr:hypothetical protein PHYBOEH_003819 [Phytophthora boehmeriae]